VRSSDEQDEDDVVDLSTVTAWRIPAGRRNLALATGEAYVAGGTFLFSEPNPRLTGLVDLAALDWAPWEALPDGGLRIGATCTIAALQEAPWPTATARVVRAAADALLMSWKVQAAATVGGNVCLALPAGAMTSLTAALAGEAVVWTAGGEERREPISSFVSGVGTTTLAPGEVLRAVDVPAFALAAPTALRRISLAERGRSAAVVVGRRDPDAVVLTVTASTPRPVVLVLPPVPTAASVRAAVRGIADFPGWYSDPHGAPAWRAAMTELLALEVCDELAALTGGATGEAAR